MQLTDRLETDTREGVRVLRFAQPARKNALDTESYLQLVRALDQAAADEAVRVLVLTGSETCFCGGNDLGDFIENPIRDEQHPVYCFMRALRAFAKPVIVAVEGPAIGIGCTLLLHADLVYAGGGSYFRMPFVPLGLCPEFASTWLLPRMLGHPRAAELLLLGKTFDADQACSFGMVNAVVSPGEALEAALQSARQLAAAPATAVLQTKRLMKQGQEQYFDQAMQGELGVLIAALQSDDFKAAAAAFFRGKVGG